MSTYFQYSQLLDRNVDGDDLDFNGYGLLDGTVAYQTGFGKVSLGVENLLDKDYFTY